MYKLKSEMAQYEEVETIIRIAYDALIIGGRT